MELAGSGQHIPGLLGFYLLLWKATRTLLCRLEVGVLPKVEGQLLSIMQSFGGLKATSGTFKTK